ncbi:MAG: hypothetical protein AUH86_08745 [Acidobacteria bacterium 13_1_40CM_4_58_4]|nr:MAG: hypothetical protein AUH86_08745 [Acidobacteria bacterium 13_1_40CM_4_58_4]
MGVNCNADVLRETSQAYVGQFWLRKRVKALLKKWYGTDNAQVREAWIEKTLKELPKGNRLLDAGAGELQYKRFCGHLRYVSQDFGQYDGMGDGSGLQMGSWDNSQTNIISDIINIPEPDASFDAIMCIEVLEHLPAPIEALREFCRLLHPGGVLILTAPFASLTHLAPYHFYSGFNRNFYIKWLDELGFAIAELVPNGNYFEFLRQELTRVRAIGKRYTRKRRVLSALEYLALFVIARALKRLSSSDIGSDSLLCYGYMVKAIKI